MRDFADARKSVYGCVAAVLVAGAVSGVSPTAPRAQAEEEGGGIEFAPDDDAPPPPSPPAGGTPAKKPAKRYDTQAPAKADKYTDSDGVEHKIYQRGESHNDQLFGAYRVSLMYGVPTFNDGLKYYNQLYGSPKGYPEIAIDWFAWDWYATLGLSFRFGYYTASGHAAQIIGNDDPVASQATSSNIQKDPNGPSTLTLIPLQLLATGEFTPFQKKWAVVRGWFGLERLYYQETRDQLATSTTPSTTTTTTTSPTTTTTPTTTSTSGVTVTPDTTLTNTGWRNSTVVGVSLDLLLNGFDEESTASLRPIGIGYVYISPYLEWVRTFGLPANNTVSFGRTVIGVSFSFESVR